VANTQKTMDVLFVLLGNMQYNRMQQTATNAPLGNFKIYPAVTSVMNVL